MRDSGYYTCLKDWDGEKKVGGERRVEIKRGGGGGGGEIAAR